MATIIKAQTPFNVLIKPHPGCQLNCPFCHAEQLRRHGQSIMTAEVSKEVIRQVIESQPAGFNGTVYFKWQGGEPTLMGVDFFKLVVQLQQQIGNSASFKIGNSLQTNGLLLADNGWLDFLSANAWLLGISLNGPEDLHDHWRGEGSYQKVRLAIDKLRQRGIAFDTSTLVTKAAVTRAAEIYNHLTQEIGARTLKILPFVNAESPDSLTGDDWGEFLINLFNAWFLNGFSTFNNTTPAVRVNVFNFWEPHPITECVRSPLCNGSVVIDSLGNIWPCDFRTGDHYRLGNLITQPLGQILNGEKLQSYGQSKFDLPDGCLDCQWLEYCWGECPRTRIVTDLNGKSKSVLCAGWQRLFNFLRAQGLLQPYHHSNP